MARDGKYNTIEILYFHGFGESCIHKDTLTLVFTSRRTLIRFWKTPRILPNCSRTSSESLKNVPTCNNSYRCVSTWKPFLLNRPSWNCSAINMQYEIFCRWRFGWRYRSNNFKCSSRSLYGTIIAVLTLFGDFIQIQGSHSIRIS